jgi:hypothetical protein
MSVLERENIMDVTTETLSFSGLQTSQSNPATRRFVLDAFTAEIETQAIERNQEFHATVLARAAVPAQDLVDADDIL